jgi:formylglycine-generating enzyme required for sulfatase activity
VTQEQYVTFLNSLSRNEQCLRQACFNTNTSTTPSTAANTFAMSNTSTPSARNGIRCQSSFNAATPVIFFNDLDGDGQRNETGDGQNVACNFLSQDDIKAYLDWSALAPYTEMQFEKVCRGANITPVALEFPWGTTTLNAYTSISNGGASNETANPSGTATTGNAALNSSTLGPIRVGSYYQSATTRQNAGSSYYGVADMGGNLWEVVMPSASVAASTDFRGEAGDGDLSTNMTTQSQITSPGTINVYTNFCNSSTYAIPPNTSNQCSWYELGYNQSSTYGPLRGGAWNTTTTAYARTSNRFGIGSSGTSSFTTRRADFGARGARN